jgi:DNA-binding transcriptional regulator YdaS (Cro superfamily)
METQIKPIKRAIEIMGRVYNLSEAMGCHRDTVYRWIQPSDHIRHINCSAEQAIKIERATKGKVTRLDICPHLYGGM